MQKKDLDTSKNQVLSISNSAIKGKQGMPLYEAKTLRLVITQVCKQDKELMEYQAPIQEIATAIGITEKNMWRDIQEICAGLTERRLGMFNSDNERAPWAYYPWMAQASFDENGVVTLALNERIKEFVLELNGYFTQIPLENILAFKSTYSLRIYEIIKSDWDACRHKKCEFTYSIEDLRRMLDCEKKYARISQFQLRILEVACDEISGKSDILLNYRMAKTGRKITKVIFTVVDKEKTKHEDALAAKKNESQEPEVAAGQNNIGEAYAIQAAISAVSGNCSMDEATRIYAAYGGDMAHFYANFGYVTQRHDVINPIGYLLEISKSWPKMGEHEVKKEKRKRSKKSVDIEISEDRKKAYEDLDQLDEERFWQE